MKQLNIKNFTKSVMDMDSDYFTIKYSTERDDKYVIGVDGKYHYKVAIHKDMDIDSDSFQVWIWDVEKNMSYPLSVHMHNLTSIDNFRRYLTGIIQLADRGDFSGEIGCRITLK
jgi:hypothetical protein